MNTTIFKNYTIIDNVLDNPYELVNQANSINYFTNESNSFKNFNLSIQNKPTGIWRGYRSEQLDILVPDLFYSTSNQIIEKILGIKNFQYVISSYLHRGDKSIQTTDLWHVDKNVLLAFIVYLNFDPPEKSGTLLKINDEIIPIENRFNRLLVYNSSIEHRVENFFGDTFENSRLTLTGFVHKLAISN